jgi:hypothetical protein
VFLFDDRDLEADWALGPILEEHYGKDEAQRLADQWSELTVPVRHWADGLDEAPGTGQVAWTCSPVVRAAT